MDLQLADKRALVTGGSRGIGRAAASALLREGAQVAIAARDRDALDLAADELAGFAGRAVAAFQVDTASDDSVAAMASAVAAELGGVDILVNAAARPAGQSAPPRLADLNNATFWDDVNVKVLGYLRCIRAFAPDMVAGGWGRIVSVAGLATYRTGSIVGSIRNVSVAALTKNVAAELRGTGVNVTTVHPGVTRTEATSGVVARTATSEGVSAADVEARFGASTLLGRIVDASEVADVVAFLASPLSVAINGDAVLCGGGLAGTINY